MYRRALLGAAGVGPGMNDGMRVVRFRRVTAAGWLLLGCAPAALVPALCSAAQQVVTPDDMRRHMQGRAADLRAAMVKTAVPLIAEDFEARPVGRLGSGRHGEPILGGAFRLGYDRADKVGDDFHVAVSDVAGSRRLCVADRRAGAGIYVRLNLDEPEGHVAFDLLMARARPMTVSLCAYQVVLTIPNVACWRDWFGAEPYRPEFVYLEGTGAGYNPHDRRMRGNYRPVRTGFVPEPDRAYRMAVEWVQARRTSTVTVDGVRIVDRRPYLSNLFRTTESICWSSSSAMGHTGGDNAEFCIDNIEAVARVWDP